MQCTECGQRIAVPTTLQTVSCPRCGDTYRITDGIATRFYPALHMHPVTAPIGEYAALSKWMLPRTRPIRDGEYDCRFRHTEPAVLRLHWDGTSFRDAAGVRVQMREFLSWRGVLA